MMKKHTLPGIVLRVARSRRYGPRLTGGAAMPIFEFKCRACGESFEELVGVTADNGEVVCPHCGSANVQKKISGFASVGSRRSSSAASSCAPGGG